jgi:hypothetical protein
MKVNPRMNPKSINQLFANPGIVCRLRLDANNQFASAKSFLEFYDQLLPRVQDSVEFIEEPTPYTSNEWETLAKQGLRLALDRELSSYKSGDESVTHFVVKPLVHDAGVWAERAALEMKRVVVSHNMDPDLAFQYCVGVQQQLSQKHPLLLDVPGLGAWHQGVLAGIGAEPEDPKLIWSEL